MDGGNGTLALVGAVVATVSVTVGDEALLTFIYPNVESVHDAPTGQPLGALK